jgi:hypothetical protein
VADYGYSKYVRGDCGYNTPAYAKYDARSTAEGIQEVMRELLEENGEMPYKDYCSIYDGLLFDMMQPGSSYSARACMHTRRHLYERSSVPNT